MENNYPKAYKEVIEILNFVPKESVNKIPQTVINTFKAKMDKNYVFTVDVNKSFEEQELLDETKAILANIFRDYWTTPYQKEIIETKEKYDRQKIEEEKRIKYNPNEIFNKKNDPIIRENADKIDNLPVEVKKEKWGIKIIFFFKRLFHIK